MKLKLSQILIFFVFFLSSCGRFITKEKAFPLVYEEKPSSIVVLPPINSTTAAEAPDSYLATIAPALTNQGYYVVSTQVSSLLFQTEGFEEITDLENIPYKALGEYFNTDAVLIVDIKKWDTNYYVIGGNVVVGIESRLISVKTGNVIWKYTDELTVDTSEGNSGSFLGNLIATAIKTAAQDYLPIAQKVNILLVNTMPFGYLNKKYLSDKKMKAVNVQKKDAVK